MLERQFSAAAVGNSGAHEESAKTPDLEMRFDASPDLNQRLSRLDETVQQLTARIAQLEQKLMD